MAGFICAGIVDNRNLWSGYAVVLASNILDLFWDDCGCQGGREVMLDGRDVAMLCSGVFIGCQGVQSAFSWKGFVRLVYGAVCHVLGADFLVVCSSHTRVQNKFALEDDKPNYERSTRTRTRRASTHLLLLVDGCFLSFITHVSWLVA